MIALLAAAFTIGVPLFLIFGLRDPRGDYVKCRGLDQ